MSAGTDTPPGLVDCRPRITAANHLDLVNRLPQFSADAFNRIIQHSGAFILWCHHSQLPFLAADCAARCALNFTAEAGGCRSFLRPPSRSVVCGGHFLFAFTTSAGGGRGNRARPPPPPVLRGAAPRGPAP